MEGEPTLRPEPMPEGFLTLEQFERDLTAAIRSARQPLQTERELHAFSQQYFKDALAIEDNNLIDIEHIVDHMADMKSGVIHDILQGDTSEAARARLEHLHEEITEFEKHRNESIVPRRNGDIPVEK